MDSFAPRVSASPRLRGPRSAFAFVLAASLSLTLVQAPPADAGDWPQIRGRDRDGVAHGEDLARAWGEDGPPALWRRDFGAGFAGMAVVGDRLYTMAAGLEPAEVEGEAAAEKGAVGSTEDALCLDAATGAVLWRTTLGTRFVETFGDGPRMTPTVDGDRVYFATSDLQLAALSATDGGILWRWDLGAAFGTEVPRFGYSVSPAVFGDLLVVDVGGRGERGVMAFDKGTGEIRWQSLEGAPSHASPLAVRLGGREQLVFHRRAGNEIVSLSPSGDVLWRHGLAQDILAMPHFVPPNGFLVSSATTEGIFLKVDPAGDGFEISEAWRNPKFRNHFSNSVRVGGHFYGFDNATLRAVAVEDGAPGWAARGFGKGSLAAAGDLLVVLGDKGTLALVEATPERYVELGRFQAMEGRSWTPPTVAGGRVYVRDQDEIAAFDISRRATPKAAAARADGDGPVSTALAGAADTVDGVLERYTAASGGLGAWRKVDTLRMAGTYATFSVVKPFVLEKKRGDLYRIEHGFLGGPIVKARDSGGPWWTVGVFGINEPARVGIPGYVPVLERESLFEPPLLDAAAKGHRVELLGPGEVDGRPTVDLRLILENGWEETWHLDAGTFLEVAVDSTVPDATQGQDPFARRTFFSDFRDVEGLMLPHRVSHEFGARLEEMAVERVELNPDLPEERFRFTGEEPADGGESQEQ
ncbi:MAG: PQQ-binding-like beta-propeller repeat protein [Acidobacteriota bacterium]